MKRERKVQAVKVVAVTPRTNACDISQGRMRGRESVMMPAKRRMERRRCASEVVATPATRLLFTSPAQARQESRC